jgi:hypothetical protein
MQHNPGLFGLLQGTFADFKYCYDGCTVIQGVRKGGNDF